MIGFDTCCNDDNGTNVTLGKIKLTDANGDVFTDLDGALAYVQQFTTAEITETSFADGVFYFTVPEGTEFLEKDNFCSAIDFADGLQFEDVLGLVRAFDNFAFYQNAKNNILKSASFKEQAFYGSTGINTVTDCIFTGSNCFTSSTAQNKVTGCIFEKGNHFIRSEGDNLITSCEFDTVTLEGSNFKESTGKNKINNCRFYAEMDFSYSEGFNEFEKSTIIGNKFFFTSSGNNVFNQCTITGDLCFGQSTGDNNFSSNTVISGTNNFNSASGNNTFGNDCTFTGDYFGAISTGNNTFGNNINATGNNFFLAASGKNKFGNNCVFGGLAFSESSGKNIFGNDNTFGNYSFENSTSENHIGFDGIFGRYAFRVAFPKYKNSIASIKNCDIEFAKNYTGRFDVLYQLGTDGTATLPADIFTTANICSIHIPNELQYNNGGSPDGDLVNLLANVTDPNSIITYD